MISAGEALDLLDQWSRGDPWRRHCLAVADRAADVGAALQPHWPLDHDFLWSAALLHDIGRHATHDPVRHGAAGYRLLARLGHPREARVCASHVLFGLRAEEAVRFGLPDRDFVPRSIEEKLVALVDYLIEFDRPTTLERRFRSLRRRNAGHPFFLEGLERAFAAARAFMEQIECLIGISLEDMPAAGTPRKKPPKRGNAQASRDMPSMNSGKVVF